MTKLNTILTKLPQAITGTPAFFTASSVCGMSGGIGGQRDEVVGEVEAADGRPMIGMMRSFDERLDDLAERGADDHADGEVDHVALDGEFPEFRGHAHGRLLVGKGNLGRPRGRVNRRNARRALSKEVKSAKMPN